jgi:hypothetical protein
MCSPNRTIILCGLLLALGIAVGATYNLIFFSIAYPSDSYKRESEKYDLLFPNTEDERFLDSVLQSIFPQNADEITEEKSVEYPDI